MRITASVLNETVAVEKIGGHSAYGPVHAETYEAQCYMEPGFKRVTDKTGAEVICSVMAIFGGDCEIAVGDIVTWDSRRYEVVDVQKLRPGGVTHHIEAYLKSAGEA